MVDISSCLRMNYCPCSRTFCISRSVTVTFASFRPRIGTTYSHRDDKNENPEDCLREKAKKRDREQAYNTDLAPINSPGFDVEKHTCCLLNYKGFTLATPPQHFRTPHPSNPYLTLAVSDSLHGGLILGLLILQRTYFSKTQTNSFRPRTFYLYSVQSETASPQNAMDG